MLKRYILAILPCTLCVQDALAHITLAQPSAEAGSSYTAEFRVPHGCSGSATTGITVFLPPSIDDAKGIAKDGWLLSQKTETLENPRDLHGTTVTQRVAQVSWSGGRLPNDGYDEFVVQMTLPDTPGKRWFHVLQQCEQGQNDWAAVPQEGQPRASHAGSRPRYHASATACALSVKTIFARMHNE